MSRFNPICLLLVLAGGPLAAGVSAQGKPVADEALRLPETLLPGLAPLIQGALNDSSRVLQARLALATSQAEEQDARSGLYPHANVTASADGRREILKDQPGSRYNFNDSYGGSVTQPVYHWGALANRARIGEIERQLAEHEFTEARRNLVLELRAQYTGLIVRRLDLAQARWDDRRHADQLQRDVDRAARGEVASLDLADERLVAQDCALAVERLTRAWDRASGDFAVLIGARDFPGDNLPAEIPPVPDWTAGLRPAANPIMPPVANAGPPAALAAVAQEREVAALNLEIARVQQRPMFNLVAGATQDFVFGAQVFYLGFQANWNIFDGGATSAAVSRARTEVRRKTLAYDLAEQALQRQLADDWKDLELAQRELAVKEARFTQSAARLAADQPRKDAGQISADDWDRRRFDHEQLRGEVQRLRAAQLLRVAEYALLQERGTRPSASITFP